MNLILEIKDIYKSFGEKQVLKGISFSAESGQAFGLLGRNGAGKTTSIRILMDVFKADSGEVLYGGKPIDHSSVSIGYLPEERGLYPKKKIFSQLVYFAMLKGMNRTDAGKSVTKWLDRLGMSNYKDKKLETLSKGNQQKIQLITALAHDPDIIVLDEPFSGLDPVNAMTLEEVVKEEIARGKTVIFSSHQMNYIEEFCDRIAILNGGKIAVSGGLDEIKRSYPRNRLVVLSDVAAEIAKSYENSSVERIHGTLRARANIHLPDGTDVHSEMAKIAAKYPVDEIRIFEPSLSDIFVEYAGDSETKKEDL